jgi:hypothetical protein
MDIEFSQHALDQLKVRSRITREMVIGAIEAPDMIRLSYRGRQLYQKYYGSETLEVVVVREETKMVIITEYFLT